MHPDEGPYFDDSLIFCGKLTRLHKGAKQKQQDPPPPAPVPTQANAADAVSQFSADQRRTRRGFLGSTIAGEGLGTTTASKSFLGQ